VGARNLDPGELEHLAGSGIDDSLERALAGVDGVYVALDLDVLDPGDAAMFMPEPAGLRVEDVERLLREVATTTSVVGAGVTGLLLEERNVPVVTLLLAAAGL
jgi:arginase family enzyme